MRVVCAAALAVALSSGGCVPPMPPMQPLRPLGSTGTCGGLERAPVASFDVIDHRLIVASPKREPFADYDKEKTTYTF